LDVTEELKDRVEELEFLNKSNASDLERSERELESLRRENFSLRTNHQQEVIDLKVDHSAMREKVHVVDVLNA